MQRRDILWTRRIDSDGEICWVYVVNVDRVLHVFAACLSAVWYDM